MGWPGVYVAAIGEILQRITAPSAVVAWQAATRRLVPLAMLIMLPSMAKTIITATTSFFIGCSRFSHCCPSTAATGALAIVESVVVLLIIATASTTARMSTLIGGSSALTAI